MKKQSISNWFNFNTESHKENRRLLTELKTAQKNLSEIIAQQDQRLSAEKELRQATWAFSRALDKLNTIYAQQNLGTVEIEDILLHDCIDQTTLNQRYARHQEHLNKQQ